MYTIKCDAMSFKLNKSHKKILKRMNKFLRDGIKDHSHDQQRDARVTEGQKPQPSKAPSAVEIDDINVESIQPNELKAKTESIDAVDGQVQEKKKSAVSLASDCDRPSNPKKAKLIRLERKKEKLAAKGLTLADVPPKKAANSEKSLEEFLAEEPTDGKHRLEVRTKKLFVNMSLNFPLSGKTNSSERRIRPSDLRALQKIPNDGPQRSAREAQHSVLRTFPSQFAFAGKHCANGF